MEHSDAFNCTSCWNGQNNHLGITKAPFRTVLPNTIQPGWYHARCMILFPSSAAGEAVVAKKRSSKSWGVIQAEILSLNLCIHL